MSDVPELQQGPTQDNSRRASDRSRQKKGRLKRQNKKGSVSFHEADERLEEESQCPQHAHRHENPQENPVDDHRHVLPVILHLQQRQGFRLCFRKINTL